MGHAYLRGAPQDDEFRLRSARSHRATSVRARPCNPTIPRVRDYRWGLDLSGNGVLGNGSIELALPLLIGIPHAHGNPIGEARTRRLFDQWYDSYRGGRLSGVIAGHGTP